MVDGFKVREAEIYKPYPDEVPWELLLEGDPDETRIGGYLDQELIRVAKFRGEVIAVYVVKRLSRTQFQLANIAVAQGFRGKGLGHWLLSHAIGLAETKGAREIVVSGARSQSFFEKHGFERNGENLLLSLTPE